MSLNNINQPVRLFPLHLIPLHLKSVLCILCLLFTASFSVFAQESDAQPSAELLFVSSGLQSLIEKIPGSTASSFEAALTTDQLPEQFSQVEPARIKAAIGKAFIVETFDKYLIQEIEQTMSQESIEKMLTWYASPLGTQIKQAEISNSLLSEHARFEAYQQELADTGVDAEREQLIHRMDNIMQSTEAAVDMVGSMQIAFNLSLSRFLPEEQRWSREEMESMAQQNQARLMAHYRAQTREVLLFTYQDLDNDDLRKLNTSLETVAGQQFVMAVNTGIKKGMFAASLDLGDELGALIGDRVDGPGI